MSVSANLATFILISGAVPFSVSAQTSGDQPEQDPVVAQETEDLSDLRAEALERVNDARAEAGLPDLVPSDILDRAAQGHAADMLERDFYDHVTPEGDTPFDRFLAADGNRWAVSGENIATCEGCEAPPDSERLRAFHEGWMQSPGHRQNILQTGFDSFGFGIVGEDDVMFAVQTFSGPGSDSDTDDELTPDAARELALEKINAKRAEAGHDPLAESEALDTAAERMIDSLATDPEAPPEDVFGLLPEGSTGWTRLEIQSASLGGTGTLLSQEDVEAVISDWAAASESDETFGDSFSTHLGFAAVSEGDGRTTAVAIFGGRGD